MEKLILFKQKTKPLLNRHPWIFSGAVKQRPEDSRAEMVEIRDEAGSLFGFGFYDHSAQLICKVFHFGEIPEGGFGKTFWKNKLESARRLRHQMPDAKLHDTWRLCHAEADGIPGLVADVYGGNTVSFHTTCPGTLQLVPVFAEIFQEMGFQFLFHRHGKGEKGVWISPVPELPLNCRENKLQFLNNPETGQKTGFFIDQRENRKLIGMHSKGRKVLNAFAYTGGFSVYAIAGGAREVVSVDISSEACSLAEANVRLNFPDYLHHRALVEDCFQYLRRMPEDFDLIILDPPAFAKNRASVDQAARGYKEINLQAMKKIRSGGILATFSCSQHISRELFQKIVFAAALDAGRQVRILQFTGQPADHPVSIFHPEGEYLKGMLLWVE